MDVEGWDREAATFDLEPDHGLLEPEVRHAWAELLARHLPRAPGRILDVGCGTGSLALLMAEAGHEVSGIDASTQMLARAHHKASDAGVRLGLVRGDAARPPVRASGFDAVVCRHLLWSLTGVDSVLERWSRLLRPAGVLLLVEGQWSTGAGVPAEDLVAVLHRLGRRATVRRLTDQRLWGRAIADDRYLILSGS